MYPILDTRVLIQIGVKLEHIDNVVPNCLRALLIQIGVKHAAFFVCVQARLRALLIQIGVKQLQHRNR